MEDINIGGLLQRNGDDEEVRRGTRTLQAADVEEITEGKGRRGSIGWLNSARGGYERYARDYTQD